MDFPGKHSRTTLGLGRIAGHSKVGGRPLENSNYTLPHGRKRRLATRKQSRRRIGETRRRHPQTASRQHRKPHYSMGRQDARNSGNPRKRAENTYATITHAKVTSEEGIGKAISELGRQERKITIE